MSKKIINKVKEEKEKNKKNINSSIKKLKMLITVVDRSKALYYVDLLEQFEVNMQTVIYGKGTAGSEMISLLGLAEPEKAIIISFVRDDKINDIKDTLTEKFNKIKNGKGIAFAISMKSIIGVSIYQFLSNNKTFIKGEENNG